MTDSEAIGPDENLWRGVFSSGHAKSARQGKIKHNIFLEKPGKRAISVNRLDGVSEDKRTRIGEVLAADRPNQGFHGWAVAPAARVRESGMEAKATPSRENPRHADIVLPPEAGDRIVQREYAQELARIARWVPRG